MLLRALCLLLVIGSAVCGGATEKVPRWEFNFLTPQAATNPVIYYDLALVPTNTSLHVFQANTGSIVWSFDFPAGDAGGYAAASNELVVVGTLNHVYALSWNGSLVWTFDAPNATRTQPFNHFRPSFGATGIYVTTGYTPLLKISAADGSLLWATDSSLGVAQLHATESADGTTVYVVSAVSGLEYALALAAADGQQQWNVSGVVTIIVAHRLGLLYCQGGNATASTLRAVDLATGRLSYQLTYEGMVALDYYVWNTSLYVDVGPTQNPFPTTLMKYDGFTGTPRFAAQGVSFLFFIPCSKGVVNFGPQHASAYDGETGSLLWRYAGTAVNDGATTENDIVLMITSTAVVALDF